MKKIYLSLLMAIAVFVSYSQTTIAFQDFEGGSDDWSYTTSPDPTEITASGDEWGIVNSLGGITTLPVNNLFFRWR